MAGVTWNNITCIKFEYFNRVKNCLYILRILAIYIYMQNIKSCYYKNSNLIHDMLFCYSCHCAVVMYDVCSSYKHDLRLFELLSVV